MNAQRLRFLIARALPYGARKLVQKFLNHRRRKKEQTIETKLDDIRNILTFNMPITQVPQALGKLRLLQEGNAALLFHFGKVLRESGIQFWLDYGTLLGAVRHHGFIPWDDDLDVSMMRSDYDRLLELLPTLFPKAEGFTWSSHAFLHIGYKGTPLNIDVFPHYFCSESLSSQNKQRIDEGLNAIRREIVYSSGMINKTDREILELIDQHIPGGSTEPVEGTPAIFLSPAVAFIKNTIMAYEDIFPLKTMAFEGEEFPVPNHTRQCLQRIYGDYMSYPPRVGFWHSHMADVVKREPFESAVNRFIDCYGK